MLFCSTSPPGSGTKDSEKQLAFSGLGFYSIFSLPITSNLSWPLGLRWTCTFPTSSLGHLDFLVLATKVWSLSRRITEPWMLLQGWTGLESALCTSHTHSVVTAIVFYFVYDPFHKPIKHYEPGSQLISQNKSGPEFLPAVKEKSKNTGTRLPFYIILREFPLPRLYNSFPWTRTPSRHSVQLPWSLQEGSMFATCLPWKQREQEYKITFLVSIKVVILNIRTEFTVRQYIISRTQMLHNTKCRLKDGPLLRKLQPHGIWIHSWMPWGDKSNANNTKKIDLVTWRQV